MATVATSSKKKPLICSYFVQHMWQLLPHVLDIYTAHVATVATCGSCCHILKEKTINCLYFVLHMWQLLPHVLDLYTEIAKLLPQGYKSSLLWELDFTQQQGEPPN
jgi:hypothetical protein